METNVVLDERLAKIVSYLTFDGHLSEDLKCFYLSSKRKEMLTDFEKLVFFKFKIKGRLEKGTGYGESYKYRIFSRDISKFLFSIGAPKGCKVNKIFNVPSWIKENENNSKAYLSVAFACEGGFWKEGDFKKIRFGLAKNSEILENGIYFIEEIKQMLLSFNVKTTEIWSTKGNNRKDGNITRFMYFKLAQSSIPAFLKQFSFNDRFKNKQFPQKSQGDHGCIAALPVRDRLR